RYGVVVGDVIDVEIELSAQLVHEPQALAEPEVDLRPARFELRAGLNQWNAVCCVTRTGRGARLADVPAEVDLARSGLRSESKNRGVRHRPDGGDVRTRQVLD